MSHENGIAPITQNSKLKTQNSKLKTQNYVLAFTYHSRPF